MRPKFRRLPNGELVLDYTARAKELKSVYNKSKKEKSNQPKQSLTPDEVSIEKLSGITYYFNLNYLLLVGTLPKLNV